jgi:hypothetical protein
MKTWRPCLRRVILSTDPAVFSLNSLTLKMTVLARAGRNLPYPAPLRYRLHDSQSIQKEIWSWISRGPKHDYAGEGHQKFIRTENHIEMVTITHVSESICTASFRHSVALKRQRDTTIKGCIILETKLTSFE